jgi:hypothetical protein
MRMGPSVIEAAVCAALAGSPLERDTTLLAQDEDRDGAWSGHEAQLGWCGSYDAFRHLYPYLPQSYGNQPGGCVDLWVEIDADGLLAKVDFEGLSLAETYRRLQRPAEAEEVHGLIGLPAADLAPELARHLIQMLSLGSLSGG